MSKLNFSKLSESPGDRTKIEQINVSKRAECNGLSLSAIQPILFCEELKDKHYDLPRFGSRGGRSQPAQRSEPGQDEVRERKDLR